MTSSRQSAAAVWSAGAVLSVGFLLAISYDLGPEARHMGLHVLLMNVAAPLAAVFVASRFLFGGTKATYLWVAALAQVVLLWTAHAPVVQNLALSYAAVQLSMHSALLLSALSFWVVLLTLRDQRRWQGLLALALTGKLVCLLAVLLVFAPRTLYGPHHQHGPNLLATGAALDDQQLAGLFMMAACTLSYMTAAVMLAVQLVIPKRRPDAIVRISG